MRYFIILCIFATASASAASLGYDYSRQSNYGRQYGGNNGFEEFPITAHSPEQGIQSGPVYNSDYSAAVTGPAEYQKEYFTFSAPENEFNDNLTPQLNSDLKPGLRVIFIKSPENTGVENAAIKLAKLAAKQHTAIYVLSKQSDVGDLAKKLNVLNTNDVNKPEVHFVKYRTPADAENAQRAIQNQYDGLKGKSSSHDGGEAPVLNFASRTPTSSYSDQTKPANAYLPVIKFI